MGDRTRRELRSASTTRQNVIHYSMPPCLPLHSLIHLLLFSQADDPLCELSCLTSLHKLSFGSGGCHMYTSRTVTASWLLHGRLRWRAKPQGACLLHSVWQGMLLPWRWLLVVPGHGGWNRTSREGQYGVWEAGLASAWLKTLNASVSSGWLMWTWDLFLCLLLMPVINKFLLKTVTLVHKSCTEELVSQLLVVHSLVSHLRFINSLVSQLLLVYSFPSYF